METLDQLDDCKLGLIDCLKSRSFELRQTEAEVERLRATIREIYRIIYAAKIDGTISRGNMSILVKQCGAALHEGGNDDPAV
jgi:hypothetical protein